MANFEDLSVMVVDDVQTMQTHIKQILEPFRFAKIETFPNGEEARAALKNEVFHLLIVDLHMRPSDGLELLRYVRESERFNHIPFIMLSVDAVESQVKDVVTFGVDDYLLKPLDPDSFVDRVLDVLKKRELI